ncbi:MAG: ATP phosphoribosyltransferase regulatory subunit [Gammaproteobacteria bacterium]|nr:ATP phosphoribosyltransferase regulatory subunit [Gammaproteobacteria bacterium]
MSTKDQWLLPEGIDQLLPPEAWRLECARRELLDLFSCWGYDLIIPPLIEYLESLLTGTGNDLDLQTFKVTDQLTGRMMGLRADMTPQAARIDAHPLQRSEPTRLCYLGTVLHTRNDGFGGSRSPLQVGAELFGHAGVESDVEIITLLLESLQLLLIPDIHIDLGHVGIFRGLARDAGLSAQQENELFEALQRKAVPEIEEMLKLFVGDAGQRQRLAALADLNGDRSVLQRAREQLAGASEPVLAALDNLGAIAALIEQRAGKETLYFDLAELRGYRYQTGMVFAVFVPGCGQEIARGGRYDAIGKVFGRSRPATGFSTDLRELMQLSKRSFVHNRGAIFAPAGEDEDLTSAVTALRQSGERVVRALPGQAGAAVEMGCDRLLVNQQGQWVVKPV